MGRLLWTRTNTAQTFVVGSAGLTQRSFTIGGDSGIIPHRHDPSLAPADRLIVISGSCSPVTEIQIRWAMQNGFAHFRIDLGRESRLSLITSALSALSEGRSIVLYTALGLADCGGMPHGEELGSYLGSLLRELLMRSGARRALVAGGDTSSHAVRQLNVHALTFAGITVPGAPLCRCHSSESWLDGIEIVLKGGQVGPENYFEIVRKGN